MIARSVFVGLWFGSGLLASTGAVVVVAPDVYAVVSAGIGLAGLLALGGTHE